MVMQHHLPLLAPRYHIVFQILQSLPPLELVLEYWHKYPLNNILTSCVSVAGIMLSSLPNVVVEGLAMGEPMVSTHPNLLVMVPVEFSMI